MFYYNIFGANYTIELYKTYQKISNDAGQKYECVHANENHFVGVDRNRFLVDSVLVWVDAKFVGAVSAVVLDEQTGNISSRNVRNIRHVKLLD